MLFTLQLFVFYSCMMHLISMPFCFYINTQVISLKSRIIFTIISLHLPYHFVMIYRMKLQEMPKKINTRPALEPTQPPIQWISEVITPGRGRVTGCSIQLTT